MARKMEQFEKWYNKNERYNHSSCEKDAWKAALECVRDTIIYESDGPSNPKDLMEWLNEELGNENQT